MRGVVFVITSLTCCFPEMLLAQISQAMLYPGRNSAIAIFELLTTLFDIKLNTFELAQRLFR